ncbi:hypothetical protein K8S19_12955 [bacterium]|nr:hypothetical protein [bacterium]
MDGEIKGYFENGKLRDLATYRNGKLEGPFKWHRENGDLKEYGTNQDGKREGTWKLFFITGGYESGTYKNGKQHGIFKHYSGNDKLLRDITYKNDRKHGIEREYWEETGFVKYRIKWKKGNKVKQESYDINGNKLGKQFF